MSEEEKQELNEEIQEEPRIIKEKPSKSLFIFLICAFSLVIIVLVILLILSNIS